MLCLELVIESNVLDLVWALNFSSQSSLVVGLIVDDCKSLLREINGCVVHFIRRPTNSVAHLLARATDSMPIFREWEHIPPPFICMDFVLDSRQ